MNYKLYEFEKKTVQFETKTDEVLYRIWQFKTVSRINLYYICFDLEKEKINEILERLLNNKLVKIISNNMIMNLYQATDKGCKKIYRKHSKANINLALFNHQDKLYQLISQKKWKTYLSEREIISAMGWDNFKKEKPHMPDLVVLDKVDNEYKYIAIEVELTAKSKVRYWETLNNYKHNLLGTIYDEVVWYCLASPKKVIEKELDSIYENISEKDKLIKVKLL